MPTVLLAPVAAYLLLYAPGHYLLRPRASTQRPGSHLFREVLLSTCCTSWIGMVLAELSIYSLPAVLSCLAALAATPALLGRLRRRWSYGSADLAGVAVLVLTWAWLSPPLDTRILGADSAGYLAAGVHLSRHGTLIIHDPTLPLLPLDLKRALFPSLGATPGTPPYLRLPGSLILRSLDSDEVLPAFHHLVAVWIAIFHGIAGSAAAQWVITLFGGLSVWAMVELATAMSGGGTALVFFLLLSLSAVQSWYSRFLMPEIPAQFFLWAGLACVAYWRSTQQRTDAILAGLAFGMAGLMRLENAAFLLAALPLGLWWAKGAPRMQRLWLLGCAAAVWGHAAVHLFFFRTHYVGILLSLFPETLALFAGAPGRRLGVLLTCIAGLLLWQYRRGFTASRSLGPVVILAACISLWGEWQHGWSQLDLLAAYIGIPTLIAGGLGLVWWARGTDRSQVAGSILVLLAALAIVQVMLAPHATPVPIWVVRRAATIVLPAFCFGVALLCHAVARRWHWSASVLLCGLALAGQITPFWQLRSKPYYQGGLRNIQAVAKMLPPGAVLFFDTPLTAWGFPSGLWAERDLPAYLLSRFDPTRVALVLQALKGRPVYWICQDRIPPPRFPGLVATRTGSYQFLLLTPTLDIRTSPGNSNQWRASLAIYFLQMPERVAGK